VTSLHVDLATPAQLLVLIGGGEFSFGDTRDVDEFLLRSMPADRRTVAFIPAASGSAERSSPRSRLERRARKEVMAAGSPAAAAPAAK